jgi:hypothetical protein
MPITLNANKFIGTLSNLICYTFYKDNYHLGDNIDALLEAFRSDDTINGDGKLVLTSDLPVVKDLVVNTSTLLTSVPPEIQEQYIPVTKFKYIQLTVNRYLMRGGFEDEYAMANLISYLLNNMRIAKRLQLKTDIETVITKIKTNNPTTQTVAGLARPTGTPTAVELNAVRTYNTNLIYRTLLTVIQKLGLGYELNITDKTNGNDTFKAYERPNNIVCLIKPSTMASMDVDTLATLLNSNKITQKINVNFIENDTITDGKILIVSKDKIQYGYFYQVATSFFDASNLNQQDFLHFSYYCDQIERAPAVLIECTNFHVE